jgi:hypothetical protein
MNVKGGSSGIIVDNSTSGTNGGSEIYFYSLSTETCASGTSGCAIQASQAAP